MAEHANGKVMINLTAGHEDASRGRLRPGNGAVAAGLPARPPRAFTGPLTAPGLLAGHTASGPAPAGSWRKETPQ
jgi:hypothetical protein